jgi:hypothetical protein
MKFICDDCQKVMEFVDNQTWKDGSSMTIRYTCPSCGRRISMVANSGETQVVRSLGVTIGHEALSVGAAGLRPAPTPVPIEPMSMIRGALVGQATSQLAPAGPEPVWTEGALKRLAAAPTFVQGMIRHLYTDYARQKGYSEITPAVMTEARDALGMTGM